MKKGLAPIVLFVYNRPEHTLKTLEALQQNLLSSESILYIYCDGPKTNASKKDIDNIKAVREVIRKKIWCKEIIIRESTTNKGLATSIINGVTEIINKHEKVIVLEDDLETSPGFLSYMNQALWEYETEPAVMHVSGYMFPVREKLPSTFFYNTCSCWGWGTWERAWDKLQTDAIFLYEQLKEKKLLSRFNIEDSADFETQLLENISKKRTTWAVKWYATMILNNGYALHPYPSLVNNIGHDETGENCGASDKYKWKELASNITVVKAPISESLKARKAMIKFYRKDNERLSTKFRSMVPSIIKRIVKKVVIKEERKEFLQKQSQLIELKRIKKLPRFSVFQTSILGFPLTIPDSASFVFMFEEIFFKKIYKFTSQSKKPLIIDCGANIGLSVLFFKQQFPDSRIIAFEPDDQIFQVLQKNVNSFGLDKVELVNKGVWAETGTLSFKREGADGGQIDFENKISEYSVKVTRLSDYLNEPVEFLKIDIEGAETVVLEECKNKLINVKYIFVEYHSFVNQEQNLNELLTVLRESGFRIYISCPGLSSVNPYMKIITYNGMDFQLNIYGIRE